MSELPTNDAYAALPARDDATATQRWLSFWAAQTLSVAGRGLTTFALGVWVFQKTGSATLFSLLTVATTLPGILTLPLVGVFTDRWGARKTLFLTECTGLLTGLLLVALFVTGAATPALLYVVLGASAVATSVHWPAYTAATTALAPPRHLARAAAMMQLGYAGQQVLAPAVAGMVLGVLGVAGVIGLDVATFAIGLVSVALLTARPRMDAAHAPLRGELRAAWKTIREANLARLAAYILLSYFPGGFVIALSTPLVLSITTARTLGWIQAAMGLGMVCGAVLSSAAAKKTGGMRRLLRYDCLLVLAMLSVGVLRSPWAIGIAGFVFLFGLSGLMAEEQTIWQLRVPEAEQGRVFSLRRTITWASLPLSYAVAGPLADYVFEPALEPQGALANVFGPLVGTGRGRGIALLLLLAGLLKAAVVAWGRSDSRLSLLDLPPRDDASPGAAREQSNSPSPSI